MDADRFSGSPVGHLVPFTGTDPRTRRDFSHSAYVPDDLGVEPTLEAPTWHAVGAAHRALARLEQSSRQLPAPQLLQAPTLSREAQSTSALEGTFAPLQEVLEASNSPQKSRSAELREVMNYYEAASDAYNWAADQRSITVGLLEQLHGTLVDGTPAASADAGTVRSTPVVIGSPSGSVSDARFVPMPPGPGLHAGLSALVEWIGDGTEHRDPLVAAALTHYQFETLHPFTDGNGRIGRLLIVLQFMADGLLTQPLLTVSPWFEQRRRDYQDQLADMSATGDWNPWVQFFAQGVEASADDTARRVDRLLAVQRRYVEIAQTITPRGGVIRDIAESLIGSPVVTVPILARRYSRTQQAVGAAVRKLVDAGVLSEPMGRYDRGYLAPDVWAAISAPMNEVLDSEAPLEVDRVRHP